MKNKQLNLKLTPLGLVWTFGLNSVTLQFIWPHLNRLLPGLAYISTVDLLVLSTCWSTGSNCYSRTTEIRKRAKTLNVSWKFLLFGLCNRCCFLINFDWTSCAHTRTAMTAITLRFIWEKVKFWSLLQRGIQTSD